MLPAKSFTQHAKCGSITAYSARKGDNSSDSLGKWAQKNCHVGILTGFTPMRQLEYTDMVYFGVKLTKVFF